MGMGHANNHPKAMASCLVNVSHGNGLATNGWEWVKTCQEMVSG